MKAKIVFHMRSGRTIEQLIDEDFADEAALASAAMTWYGTVFYPGVLLLTFTTLAVVVANIDAIEWVFDTGESAAQEPAMRGIERDVGQIRTLISKQLEQGTKQMATLAEVQADIEEMRLAAQRNADAAQANADLLRATMALVRDAAATATDLAGLKESLDAITATVDNSADVLVAAAQETPPAP